MSPIEYLKATMNSVPSNDVKVFINIPGRMLSDETNIALNAPNITIGEQIKTLKEMITLSSSRGAAMVSAEVDNYARIKIESAVRQATTLSLGMAIQAIPSTYNEPTPQTVLKNHGLDGSQRLKEFYSANWPAMYAEFGSAGVDSLLKNKSLNMDLADFLNKPQNTIRVSPGEVSSLLEAGPSKSIVLSGRNDQGFKSECNTGAFLNVNMAYMVNKGLSKYPSLQTMVASGMDVESAVRCEHIKEGAGVLSALKVASGFTQNQLKGVEAVVPWINKESINKFSEFDKITSNNDYSAKDRIEWVLEKQEDLGRMKSKNDLNIAEQPLQSSPTV